jgi:dihydrofolate reductase
MSWLTEHVGRPNPTANRLLDQIGCLLIGGRTFRGDDPNKGTDAEGAFGGRYQGPAVVLTRTLPDEPESGYTFADDLGSAVRQARDLAGDKYVNILGAETARHCLQAGELDEILMFVAPVLLGDGVRVFDHPGGTRVGLEQLPDTTELWFRIRS